MMSSPWSMTRKWAPRPMRKRQVAKEKRTRMVAILARLFILFLFGEFLLFFVFIYVLKKNIWKTHTSRGFILDSLIYFRMKFK